MRVEWEDDEMRFGLGWKHPEMRKSVTVSMTFQTFLSGGKPFNFGQLD